MAPMTSYYDTKDAALGLANALDEVKRLEAEKSRYDYSYPDRLMSDQRNAAERARAAIRFLCGIEDDEEDVSGGGAS